MIAMDGGDVGVIGTNSLHQVHINNQGITCNCDMAKEFACRCHIVAVGDRKYNLKEKLKKYTKIV